eukprot:1509942-Pleurochrysis_carterae.AAC.1
MPVSFSVSVDSSACLCLCRPPVVACAALSLPSPLSAHTRTATCMCVPVSTHAHAQLHARVPFYQLFFTWGSIDSTECDKKLNLKLNAPKRTPVCSPFSPPTDKMWQACITFSLAASSPERESRASSPSLPASASRQLRTQRAKAGRPPAMEKLPRIYQEGACKRSCGSAIGSTLRSRHARDTGRYARNTRASTRRRTRVRKRAYARACAHTLVRMHQYTRTSVAHATAGVRVPPLTCSRACIRPGKADMSIQKAVKNMRGEEERKGGKTDCAACIFNRDANRQCVA